MERALQVRISTDEESRQAGLVELCCEQFEVAIQLGVIRADRAGIAYVVGSGCFLVIAVCPFCGAKREAAEYLPRCGNCGGVKHDAKVCDR